MTPARARRMGFKPQTDAIFRGPIYIGLWMRELRRPVCKEYWDPLLPNQIRREWYSSVYQTRPSYQIRQL